MTSEGSQSTEWKNQPMVQWFSYSLEPQTDPEAGMQHFYQLSTANSQVSIHIYLCCFSQSLLSYRSCRISVSYPNITCAIFTCIKATTTWAIWHVATCLQTQLNYCSQMQTFMLALHLTMDTFTITNVVMIRGVTMHVNIPLPWNIQEMTDSKLSVPLESLIYWCYTS